MLLTARKDYAHLTPHKPVQVNDSGKNKTKAVTYVKVSRVYSYWWHEMGLGPGEKKKSDLLGKGSCSMPENKMTRLSCRYRVERLTSM